MIELEDGEGLLLYGDTERNSDLFYATRFHAPDPFFFVCTPHTRRMLISDLEFDRARTQADVDEVLSLRQYAERAKATLGELDPQHRRFAGVAMMLQELELRVVRVVRPDRHEPERRRRLAVEHDVAAFCAPADSIYEWCRCQCWRSAPSRARRRSKISALP